MNAQEPRRTVRNTRQRKITLDLNVPPPNENRELERTSAHPGAQGGSSAQPRGLLPPPIDLEAIDDEVIISSPRAFEQAKNNSRRTRGRTLVVDVESGLSSRVSDNNCVKSRRAPSNRTINDIHIYLDGSSSVLNEDAGRVAMPPLPPPPKEPSFSCPVCMGPLVEEMSTKCGHIFCKACIKASIAAQSKCPTCRRKIAMKDIIRVYLPTTS